MPPMERVLELRSEAFADDLECWDEMTSWSEADLVAYFESGGATLPAAAAKSEADAQAPASSPAPLRLPVRILSLHGGGGNKTVNMMQLARLKKALGPQVQFDHINGTRQSADGDVDPRLKAMFGDGPYFGWYGVENSAGIRSGQAHNAYTRALADPNVEFTYVGLEAALDLVERHIEQNGPYDALCGFSQGTIIITALTARRMQRAARGESAPPSWRCNILLSPMPPRAGNYASIMPPPQTPPLGSFPCVACMGVQDHFYEYAKQVRLLYGPQMRWFEHPDGHETAKDPALNSEIAQAIWYSMGWRGLLGVPS